MGAGREPPAFPPPVDVDRIAWTGSPKRIGSTGSTSKGRASPPSWLVRVQIRALLGQDQAHRGHGWLLARHNGGVTETQTDLTDDERADRLTKLRGIIDLMRPAVQADGETWSWSGPTSRAASSRCSCRAACSSCAISEATLSGGVERILHDRLPWVTDVIGGLDDALTEDESSALGSGGYVPSL